MRGGGALASLVILSWGQSYLVKTWVVTATKQKIYGILINKTNSSITTTNRMVVLEWIVKSTIAEKMTRVEIYFAWIIPFFRKKSGLKQQ